MSDKPTLTDQVGLPESGGLVVDDHAWVEVVQKMDEVYAELVQSQVALEEKNNALEEAQAFIASVLTAMSDVLIVCDVDGRVLQVNGAMEDMLGRSSRDLIGQDFRTLFPDEMQSLVADFASRIRSREPIHDCEVALTDKGGRPAPLAMNCTPRYDHEGRLEGMVLIGRPVGELRRAYSELDQAHRTLKEAQQQLVQTEKMASLGRLVAGVAHELNNPISFVYGNIHALERYGSRLQKYLEAISQTDLPDHVQSLRRELHIDHLQEDLSPLIEGSLEGAERVRDIVEDLKLFSSSQRGGRKPFDLAAVTRTAIRWAVKGTKPEIDVQIDLDEGLTVLGFPNQIQQVVINIVQNAADAMRDAKTRVLKVYASTHTGKIHLHFEDTGPGITEEAADKLFEPFFTTKAVGEGTGLGLSLSYRIVEEHAGKLSVSNADQGGALFVVSLPSA